RAWHPTEPTQSVLARDLESSRPQRVEQRQRQLVVIADHRLGRIRGKAFRHVPRITPAVRAAVDEAYRTELVAVEHLTRGRTAQRIGGPRAGPDVRDAPVPALDDVLDGGGKAARVVATEHATGRGLGTVGEGGVVGLDED